MINVPTPNILERRLSAHRIQLITIAFVLSFLAILGNRLCFGQASTQTTLKPVVIGEPLQVALRFESMDFRKMKWHSVAEFAAVEKKVTYAGRDEQRLLALLREYDETRTRNPADTTALFGCGAVLIPMGWNRDPDGGSEEAHIAQMFLLAALDHEHGCYEIGRRLLFSSYCVYVQEPNPKRDPVVELAASLLRLNNHDAQIRYAVGLHLFYNGSHKSSAEIFERLVKEYPNKVQYHSVLASCYCLIASVTHGSGFRPLKLREISQLRECLRLTPKTGPLYERFRADLKSAQKFSRW